MSGLGPANVHLRRLLPLIAVSVALGPGVASAAGPAPDQPPAGRTLAPDPAPVTRELRTPAAVTPLTVEAPKRVLRPVTPVRRSATPSPLHKRRHRVAPVQRAHAVPVVGVAPAFVDLHPGLGSLPNDESRLVLAAAAALLAAAAAAGTGTMLTLTARVRR